MTRGGRRNWQPLPFRRSLLRLETFPPEENYPTALTAGEYCE